MRRKNKKDITKWKKLTDTFAKTPSALKKIEELKAKRLFWKDKDLS